MLPIVYQLNEQAPLCLILFARAEAGVGEPLLMAGPGLGPVFKSLLPGEVLDVVTPLDLPLPLMMIAAGLVYYLYLHVKVHNPKQGDALPHDGTIITLPTKDAKNFLIILLLVGGILLLFVEAFSELKGRKKDTPIPPTKGETAAPGDSVPHPAGRKQVPGIQPDSASRSMGQFHPEEAQPPGYATAKPTAPEPAAPAAKHSGPAPAPPGKQPAPPETVDTPKKKSRTPKNPQSGKSSGEARPKNKPATTPGRHEPPAPRVETFTTSVEKGIVLLKPQKFKFNAPLTLTGTPACDYLLVKVEVKSPNDEHYTPAGSKTVYILRTDAGFGVSDVIKLEERLRNRGALRVQVFCGMARIFAREYPAEDLFE